MSTAELFPETATSCAAPSADWTGTTIDKWGHKRVNARLVTRWTAGNGWCIGWFVQVGGCVDEWHPAAPDKHKQHAGHPWYRLDEMPTSTSFAVAAGNASRALKIVIEQMLSWAEPELHAEARAMQAAIERQAQDWLCGRAA